MFTWKVEDLALKKDKDKQGRFFETFIAESQVSRDDKIAFIDSQTGGQMSELLDLYAKFQREKDTIKKDVYGGYKENSLKAWYSRNAGSLKWSEYDFGFYGIFDNRRIYNLMSRGSYSVHEDIVDQAFHKLLYDLYRKELEYFNTHDEYAVLSHKLIESHIFPLIGLEFWHGSDGIGGKKVNGKMVKYTLEELRYLNNACDKLEEKINAATAKIKASFEQKFQN